MKWLSAKVTPPSRPQIIVTVFVVTIVAVPLGIIWPNVKSIRSTAAAIYHEYSFLEERNRRGLDIRKARRDYDEAAAVLPELRQLVVRRGEELSFITAIESLAATEGVETLLSLDVNGRSNEQPRRLPFSLKVSGDYLRVANYLSKLRTLPMATSFSRISIVQPISRERGKAIQTGAVEATILGAIYWQESDL